MRIAERKRIREDSWRKCGSNLYDFGLLFEDLSLTVGSQTGDEQNSGWEKHLDLIWERKLSSNLSWLSESRLLLLLIFELSW